MSSLRKKIEDHLIESGWERAEMHEGSQYWRHPERGFVTTLAPQGAVAWQIEREEQS